MGNQGNILVLTTLLFTVIWLIFTEVDLHSLVVGTFFIIAAAVMASWLSGRQLKESNNQFSIRLITIPRLILFFVIQSILGGIDTAKRAFSPSLNIAPGFIHYQLKFLTLGVNTHLFFNLLCLLPGSLYVTDEPQGIVIHFLTLTDSVFDDIEKCERAVARLYNIQFVVVAHRDTK